MSLNQLINGFGSALFNRDELIFSAIAEKFNIPVEKVRSAAYEECDKQKPKSIKPQKRQAKCIGVEGKKPRKPAAYRFFTKEYRDKARLLLIENEEERVFFNKNEEEVVVDPSDFKDNGEPTFAQITKKVASMWAHLSKEEKEPFEKMAEEAKIEIDEQEKLKELGHESEEEESEEEESEEEEAPVRKIPPRKAPPRKTPVFKNTEESEEESEEAPPRKAPAAKAPPRKAPRKAPAAKAPPRKAPAKAPPRKK